MVDVQIPGLAAHALSCAEVPCKSEPRRPQRAEINVADWPSRLARRREPATLPDSVTQEEAEKDECNNDSSGQHLPGASTCGHLPILTSLTTRVDCRPPNCPRSGKLLPERVWRASSQPWFGSASDAARGPECERRSLAVGKSMMYDTPKNRRNVRQGQGRYVHWASRTITGSVRSQILYRVVSRTAPWLRAFCTQSASRPCARGCESHRGRARQPLRHVVQADLDAGVHVGALMFRPIEEGKSGVSGPLSIMCRVAGSCDLRRPLGP